MVVEQHDRRGGRRGASRNTSRGWTTVRVERADRDDLDPDDAVLRVEHHDAELLDRARRRIAATDRRRVWRGVSQPRPFDRCRATSVRRPSSTAASDLRGARAADAGDAAQIADAARVSPCRPPACSSRRLASSSASRARDAAAEHERQQLVVAERRRRRGARASRADDRAARHLSSYTQSFYASLPVLAACLAAVALVSRPACAAPEQGNGSGAGRHRCRARRRRRTVRRRRIHSRRPTRSSARTTPSTSATTGWRSTTRSTAASTRRTPRASRRHAARSSAAKSSARWPSRRTRCAQANARLDGRPKTRRVRARHAAHGRSSALKRRQWRRAKSGRKR